jgi:hypothetical protein
VPLLNGVLEMEIVIGIVAALAAGGVLLFLRSRQARILGRVRPTSKLVQRLASGEAGLRWQLPPSWGVQASETALLRVVDDSTNDVWQVALLPYGLDLDVQHDEQLHEDVARELEAQAVAQAGSSAKGRDRQLHVERVQVGAVPALRLRYVLPDDAKREVALGQLLIPLAAGMADISVMASSPERVAAALDWLLSTYGAKLTVTQPAAPAAPPFELSWARCRVTPPPRYLPVAQDFPRSETMDVLTRISLGSEGVRMIDVYRLPNTELEEGDRVALEQLARENAAGWVEEGADKIRCKVSAIELDDGRTHLGNHVRFDAHGSAAQTYAHWVIDEDGAVFRVGAHAPGHVPQDQLVSEARQTVESLRRLDR